MTPGLVAEVRRRLHDRPDAEHLQAAVRLVLVLAATAYFFTDYALRSSPNPAYIELARWVGPIACVVSISLAVAIVVRPGISVARRVVGILHDVAAISAAMYLGDGGAAGVAAIYLWVVLGNGFRYGTAYLYGCALVSFVSFAAVTYLSDYWASNRTLSANILILLALIPPYVGTLLRSLHKAKEQLRRQASIDVLTGLLNRAETEMSVERVLDRRHDGHALLYCDLDLFKQVNDSAGHAAGDKLLTDVARIIRDCAGGKAIVGRLGGDEFCVFLENTTIERTRQVGENIRNSVSGYRLAWGREYYGVGISVGVAPTSAVKDVGSMFRLADAACYAAKNGGRNQVHVVDPRASIADTRRIRRMFADITSGNGNQRVGS